MRKLKLFVDHFYANWYEPYLIGGAWFFYTYTHQPYHAMTAHEYITRMWLP